MARNRSIAVVDYGGGNIRSLVKALQYLDADPIMATGAGDLERADLVFFPGQGAFGDCMAKLTRLGLVEPLQDWIRSDRPFFGICVGYQLLFEGSEESPECPGLCCLEGQVVRFPDSSLKIPHMGWNAARLATPEASPWQGLGVSPYFYFVHSYYPAPSDESLVAATTDYGIPFPAAVQRDRLLATQFHPEKSQVAGMRLIENFLAQHAPR